VDDSPRASTTQPPTLEILAELGLIDEYIAQGLVSRTFQFWDRPTLRLVAEFDFERLRGETAYPYVVQTEQHKLALMGIARLRAMPNAEVRMATKVLGLAQDAAGATVQTESGELRADYVIGCDGGRSTVRKALGIEFEGFTWPERFAVISTDYAALKGLSLRRRPGQLVEFVHLKGVSEWMDRDDGARLVTDRLRDLRGPDAVGVLMHVDQDWSRTRQQDDVPCSREREVGDYHLGPLLQLKRFDGEAEGSRA